MRALVVVAVTLALGRVGHARPDCEGEARELRTFLIAEARRADTWNTLWALGFGAATVVQVAVARSELAASDALRREQLYVGAVKASIGLASKLVLPLRLHVSEPIEACADVRALHKAVALAAKKERRSMWLTIIGGTTVNLLGSAWLWIRHDFKTALPSFLSGLPVGPIGALTQPKGALRLYQKKRVDWVAGIGWVGGVF